MESPTEQTTLTEEQIYKILNDSFVKRNSISARVNPEFCRVCPYGFQVARIESKKAFCVYYSYQSDRLSSMGGYAVVSDDGKIIGDKELYWEYWKYRNND